MASQADVRRLALSLPGTAQDPDGSRFLVDGKQFAWVWMERVDPKRPRLANREVVAVRVANELEKQSLLSLDPVMFFTEPHYDGYPAVLVRLPAIGRELLGEVLVAAWRTRASARRRADLDALPATGRRAARPKPTGERSSAEG